MTGTGTRGGKPPKEPLVFRSYREWAETIGPWVRAALAGEVEVPPQESENEAWLAYALWDENPPPLPLEEVLHSMDVVGHDIPTPEQLAYALLQLRRRGWLSEHGDSYALTAEGRRRVGAVVGEGEFHVHWGRLGEWVSAHPAPIAETSG